MCRTERGVETYLAEGVGGRLMPPIGYAGGNLANGYPRACSIETLRFGLGISEMLQVLSGEIVGSGA